MTATAPPHAELVPAVPEPDDASQLIAMAQRHAAALYSPHPTVFVHGNGAYLYDHANRAYLDFSGGMGVNLLGHNHPRIVAALHQQIKALLHTSNALLTPGPIKLAARLAALCGGKQSFFVNSGTEAIEGALKLARRYHYLRGTPRHRVVACHNGFHGRTLGALSVTGQSKMQQGFAPLLSGVSFVPYDDVAAAEAAVDQTTCAIVVEPVQGNGGVVTPSAHYLAALQELARRHGALTIHDEVQTGMGRTGTFLAAEADGVDADIVCLAKALGGGLPLGAVLARPEIMAAFAKGSHGSTFGGNPLACAAALATLDALAHDAVMPRAVAAGEALKKSLAVLPHVTAVRGRGLLLGLVVENLELTALRHACFEEGLLTTQAGADVLRLFVPAVATDADLDAGVRRLAQAIARTPQKKRP